MLLILFCVVTLTLSGSALHLVTVSESRLAQMSYPKLSPQQAEPEVAALCAVAMRFSWVRLSPQGDLSRTEHSDPA